ncbi:MAG TPA: hypothetical protein VFE32_21435 [Puia sp.]|nr:hypothetical protein [Puia sp.]
MNLVEIRKHAWQLSAEVLGHGEIEDVTVKEVPSDDPAVVALILKEKGMRKRIAPSDGVHPYLKDQARKPPR